MKLDIQRFATPTSGNLIDEVALNEYHTNLKTMTGDLTDLETTDQSSLVNAINEVNSSVNVTTLWEGSFAATSTGTISWAQSKYDFDTLRIAYKLDNWGDNAAQFVDIPNNKTGMNNVNLSLIYGYNSSRQQIRSATIDIYEKSASWESTRIQHRDLSTNAVTAGGNATSSVTISVIGIYVIGGSSAVAKQHTDTGYATTDNSYISNAENNHWEKNGKVVSYSFTMTTTGNWGATTQFLSGLPKAQAYTRFMGLNTGNQTIMRFAIDTNGNISNTYSNTTPSAGHIIEGHITYISSE